MSGYIESVEDLSIIGVDCENATLKTLVVPVAKSKINLDSLAVVVRKPGVLTNTSGIEHDRVAGAIDKFDVTLIYLNGYFGNKYLSGKVLILRAIVTLVRLGDFGKSFVFNKAVGRVIVISVKISNYLAVINNDLAGPIFGYSSCTLEYYLIAYLKGFKNGVGKSYGNGCSVINEIEALLINERGTNDTLNGNDGVVVSGDSLTYRNVINLLCLGNGYLNVL